jgi:DNA-binding CsgD family transcriptional regulator
VNKHVLLYGLLGGILIALLKAVEYRFLVVEYSVEIYGGLIAAIFAALGVWLGLRITRPVPPTVDGPEGTHTRSLRSLLRDDSAVPRSLLRDDSTVGATLFVRDAAQVKTLGVTPRELEILEHIAQGLSNREIAETLYVSENTVKTHSSRLFDKLGAKRRTQAVQLGKQRGLIA